MAISIVIGFQFETYLRTYKAFSDGCPNYSIDSQLPSLIKILVTKPYLKTRCFNQQVTQLQSIRNTLILSYKERMKILYIQGISNFPQSFLIVFLNVQANSKENHRFCIKNWNFPTKSLININFKPFLLLQSISVSRLGI